MFLYRQRSREWGVRLFLRSSGQVIDNHSRMRGQCVIGTQSLWGAMVTYGTGDFFPEIPQLDVMDHDGCRDLGVVK